MEDVPDHPGFDFREGRGTSVVVGASSNSSTNGVPEEVVIAIAVNSWASTAKNALVRGARLAPET